MRGATCPPLCVPLTLARRKTPELLVQLAQSLLAELLAMYQWTLNPHLRLRALASITKVLYHLSAAALKDLLKNLPSACRLQCVTPRLTTLCSEQLHCVAARVAGLYDDVDRAALRQHPLREAARHLPQVLPPRGRHHGGGAPRGPAHRRHRQAEGRRQGERQRRQERGAERG